MKRSRRRTETAAGGPAAIILLLVLLGIGWLRQHPVAIVVGACLFVAGVAAMIYAIWQERQRMRKSGISEIDEMDGRTFERRLALLFQTQGYHVRQTKVSGDYGADLVLHKDGVTTVVQAKRYSLDRKVGVGAVQEVVSSLGFYRAQHAIVVTNSHFTEPARTLARANHVELWDRVALVRALSAAQLPQAQRSRG